MKILVPEAMHPISLQRLRIEHDVKHDPTLFTRGPELVEAARDADVLIIRNRTQVRDDLLAALMRCRAVGRLGVGLDNIDVEGCRAKGIKIIPAFGVNARSVAEYVVTTAMMLLRRSHYGVSAGMAAGEWPRPASPEGFEIEGRTLGVVGFGSIGQLTGHLADRLGMRVVAYGHTSGSRAPGDFECKMLPLEELLACSDVVSLHLPLTPETRGLIDERRLSKMRPGAILINAARGGIVDEVALAQALHKGHLHGAALDVFDTEPLPSGSALADAPNLLLTPHIAGVTADSEFRVCEYVADRIMEM
ncbi:hydroxyacid dehydrogenase [Cupriavidus sp. BIC8F]|uniref:hydroxyacid dehydrogenase n=1 Tax=Cupriavidus sp. BIC8F TaxID=3079014 RepID=UPI002915EC2D|nr:hydroxyacid dehydrogenase [Cupriavidus sp. BIC8F]